MKNYVFLFFAIIFSLNLSAQCDTWTGADNVEELKGWHTIYKSNLESGNNDVAYEYWQKVYDVAPAADGKRASHYLDGITIYKTMLENETNEDKKQEYHDIIVKLYDEAINCYQNKAISIKGCNDEKCLNERLGFLHGRKAYDLYYVINADRADSYESFKKSIELAGNKTEYFVIAPFGDLLSEKVKNKTIELEESRMLHSKITEIADANIAKGGQYKDYFVEGKDLMEQYMAQVEGEMYDCTYFKDKLLPEYNANKEDGPTIERVYKKLKMQGCEDSDPIMQELKNKYDSYVAVEKQKELERLAKTNPEIAAQLFYNNDEFSKAAAKYKEAIDKESDTEKKADYYFRLASIQGRKLGQYSQARANAQKAASLKSGWGRPYMLIGDIYAKASRNCGDAWNQRLAVLAAIDKYAYARSVEPALASEANSRIGTYSSSKPSLGQAHQRGFKEGQKLKVDCWINETVTLRF